MVPEMDGHSISVRWAVAPQSKLYREAPCGFLGHLVGHEGAGSAFAALKARGWATGLSAGESGGSFSAKSFFSVSVALTDQGELV